MFWKIINTRDAASLSISEDTVISISFSMFSWTRSSCDTPGNPWNTKGLQVLMIILPRIFFGAQMTRLNKILKLEEIVLR